LYLQKKRSEALLVKKPLFKHVSLETLKLTKHFRNVSRLSLNIINNSSFSLGYIPKNVKLAYIKNSYLKKTQLDPRELITD